MDTKISFIERTRKVDDLCKTFKCGNVVLDKFLRDESYDTDISKTYLMVENDINIVGFFSLSCSSLLEINNANRIESSAPAVSIKMFAVDQEYQDKKNRKLWSYICKFYVDCVSTAY